MQSFNREDYIHKLEKENNKLKEKIEHLTKHLDYQDICDLFKQVEEEVAQEQKLKKLELENEELKAKLTKAKEIIKKFLLWENDWHVKTESKYELLKQAEHFLKEDK